MATTADQRLELTQGPIRYRETGSGAPIVFVHGLLVNHTLWDPVVERLEGGFRCIAPDLPMGSHSEPMDRDADLSPLGMAKLVADFISALGLEDVTLVANDTGGAIAQLVVTRHPERIGRLVLTNCDAFENFLPPFFRPLQWLARVPGALALALQPLRLRPVRRSPLGFGMLTERPVDAATLESWSRPSLADGSVRRDAIKLLRTISPRYTLEAAERLHEFGGPALLAWAPADRFFKVSYAERLRDRFADARLELIDDARTFVSRDQPEALAGLIEDFAAAPAAAGRA